MKNRKAQGFTLIELLIVIAIIGILAAVLIPNLLSARTKANESAAQSFIRQTITALEANRDTISGKLVMVSETTGLVVAPTTFVTAASVASCGATQGKMDAAATPAPVLPAGVKSCAVDFGTSDNYTINLQMEGGATGGKWFAYNGTQVIEATGAVAAL